MYTSKVYLQAPNRTNQIIYGLLDTVVNTKPTYMFASIAYASLEGCRQLHEALLTAFPGWKNTRKHWLIGLDSGITEPKALQYLANLPNSNLRLFDAEYLLNNNLHAKQRFHTKLYIFESDKDKTFGIFSGSANLTLSGLFLNTEQGLSVLFQRPIIGEQLEFFNRILVQKQVLEDVFTNSTEFSSDLLKCYEEICKERQELAKNEDERKIPRALVAKQPQLDLDKATAIAIASHYWVEIRYVVDNLGKGLPGNQIDLQRGSRVFFGFDVGVVAKNTVFGARNIYYKTREYECNMRYGNNQMDKLNLPAPHDIGIDTYENKVIVFTRLREDTFRIHIFPINLLPRFRQRSGRYSTLYKMKSGREYGVY